MKKSRATNPELIELTRYLRKQSSENKSEIWRSISDYLAKSHRQRIAVNLSRLNRYTKRNETVIVPGKVLGSGELKHPITVVAFGFSAKAREKIILAKSRQISFADLIKKNPKGSQVKIIG